MDNSKAPRNYLRRNNRERPKGESFYFQERHSVIFEKVTGLENCFIATMSFHTSLTAPNLDSSIGA